MWCSIIVSFYLSLLFSVKNIKISAYTLEISVNVIGEIEFQSL